MESLTCAHSYLDREARQYDKLGGVSGIPKKIWYGNDGEHRVLVLELLGDNLRTALLKYRPCFGAEQVAVLAIHLVKVLSTTETMGYALMSCLQIERLEHIHSRGLIHCDITPGNITFTIIDNAKVEIHLIDFGFAKEWAETQKKDIFEGTPYFASANALRGLGEPFSLKPVGCW